MTLEFEGYRIDGVLGAGGFGVTYRATEVALDRTVAIKEFLPGGIVMRDTARVTVHPVGATVYQNGYVNLSVTATGGGLQYRWLQDAALIPGATSSSYLISPADATNAGSYTVIVSNTLDSVLSAAAVVNVQGLAREPGAIGSGVDDGTARVIIQVHGYVAAFRDAQADRPSVRDTVPRG